MTKHAIRRAPAALVWLLTAVALAAAPARAADPKPPVEAPQPADVLRSMSAFLAKQKAFTVHGELVFDQVLPGGPKIQLSGALDMAVERPGKLHVDYRDDVMDRLLWIENGRATIADPRGNTFSEITGPKDIDGMVAKLEKEYGMTLPLGELAESDSYAVLTRGMDAGHYVGVHDVEGIYCHHVVLEREDLSLQIFVEVGAKPVPRKLVFEYLTKPGSPQYTASLTEWTLAAPKADLFVPKIPKTAGKVDLLPLQGGR